MSRRTRASAGLGLILAAACPAVAIAATIDVESRVSDGVTVRGVGCGVSGSVTVPLPAGATNARIRQPRVGTTRNESRITEAVVASTDLRLTAVGEGTEVCDPGQSDTPPAQRTWSDIYTYDVAYTESVSVGYRRPETAQRKPSQRPTRVVVPRVAHVVGIRWQSWGGRRAIGFGRARAVPAFGRPCTARSCPGHGARMRVVLTNPVRCPEVQGVFYDRTTFYMEQNARFLRKGQRYTFANSGCPSGGRPARV